MPRHAALAVLHRWDPSRNSLDDLLEQPMRKLDARDAALTRHLVEECARHWRLLDVWIDALARPAGRSQQRSPRAIEREVRNILKIGLTQLRFSRIPPHAAVASTVDLADKRARGFVNALLRRATREPELLDALTAEADPAERFGLSDDLWAHWTAQFGATEALELAVASQTSAPVAFVINPFRKTTCLPINSDDITSPSLLPVAGHDGYFTYPATIPTEWFEAGWICVQDPGAGLALRLLEARAGEKILDACAAPGGKTHGIAAAAGGTARITASDLPGQRLERLRANLDRLGVPGVSVRAVDWQAAVPALGSFDAVLVDAPCTNTGVLRRRLDARYRFSEQTLAHATKLQADILAATAALVRPGGRLVYSTCSLEREENQQQIERFLSEHPDWTCAAQSATHPVRDGVDGHFAARLERA